MKQWSNPFIINATTLRHPGAIHSPDLSVSVEATSYRPASSCGSAIPWDAARPEGNKRNLVKEIIFAHDDVAPSIDTFGVLDGNISSGSSRGSAEPVFFCYSLSQRPA